MAPPFRRHAVTSSSCAPRELAAPPPVHRAAPRPSRARPRGPPSGGEGLVKGGLVHEAARQRPFGRVSALRARPNNRPAAVTSFSPSELEATGGGEASVDAATAVDD